MKNLSKTSLSLFHAKKAAPKTPNNKFSKISKTSYYAKAIASAKWSVWAKHLTSQKHTKNNNRTTLEFFYAKSDSRNQPLNRKIRRFQNSAKLSTLQRGQSRSKIKIVKNMQKTSLQPHQSCFAQRGFHKTPIAIFGK